MPEETKIANGAEILEEALEGEEEEEEGTSIEEEFRELHNQSEELIERYTTVADALEKAKGNAASKGDVVNLYRFLTGDVLSLLKDVISASGAAFNDTLEELENVSGAGSSEEDEGPQEDSVQVYATLLANIEAFTNLRDIAGIASAQKEGFDRMIQLNQSALKLFDDQFGEAIQTLAAEYIEAARAPVAAPDA